MKQLAFLLLILSLLVSIACKESDNDGISLLPANGKGEINEVILYRGNTAMTDGDLGGRVGVDNLCLISANKPGEKKEFIGFISIDGASDTIGSLPMNNDFPGHVPIKSKTGKIVANNWDDLMDGTISDTLANLDVLDSSSDRWWSGGRNGGDAFNTCVGFTDPTSNNGIYGVADQTGVQWVENTAIGCVNTYFYLCLAY